MDAPGSAHAAIISMLSMGGAPPLSHRAQNGGPELRQPGRKAARARSRPTGMLAIFFSRSSNMRNMQPYPY